MSLEPLILSFQVAVVATCIAGVVGVALAGLMSRARFAGADLLDVIVTAPMVLPPTVLGYYLLLAIGRNSTFGGAYEALTGSSLVFTSRRTSRTVCTKCPGTPGAMRRGSARESSCSSMAGRPLELP